MAAWLDSVSASALSALVCESCWGAGGIVTVTAGVVTAGDAKVMAVPVSCGEVLLDAVGGVGAGLEFPRVRRAVYGVVTLAALLRQDAKDGGRTPGFP